MDISVVIPSYNTEDCLKETLNKLTQQKTDKRYEIIVADCSDNTGVSNICEGFSQVKFIRANQRFNPGIGRNLGAEHAQGQLLLFVDADVHLDEHVFNNAWDHFRDGHAIFGGALELNTTISADSAAYLEHYFFNHESQARRPSCERANLSSAFMCFSKDVFLKSGGFKDIPRMQDTELTERLRASGHKLYFFSDLLGLQTQDSPMKKVLKKILLNGQNVYYIRYQSNSSITKKVIFALLLPAIGLAKTLRIIGRHLRYQPGKQKLKTLWISPLLLWGGAIWVKGFYTALLSNKGMSKER